VCSRYAALLRLQEHLDLRLIDADQQPGLYQQFLERGMDLDQGMILELQGNSTTHTYHGAECLQRLALLSSPSNCFNRINSAVFRKPALSAFVYPLLVTFRNLLLRILKRKQLVARSTAYRP